MNGKSTISATHWSVPLVPEVGLLYAPIRVLYGTPAILSHRLEATCGKHGLQGHRVVDPEGQQPGCQSAVAPAAAEWNCAFLWPPQNLSCIYILAESKFFCKSKRETSNCLLVPLSPISAKDSLRN